MLTCMSYPRDPVLTCHDGTGGTSRPRGLPTPLCPDLEGEKSHRRMRIRPNPTESLSQPLQSWKLLGQERGSSPHRGMNPGEAAPTHRATIPPALLPGTPALCHKAQSLSSENWIQGTWEGTPRGKGKTEKARGENSMFLDPEHSRPGISHRLASSLSRLWLRSVVHLLGICNMPGIGGPVVPALCMKQSITQYLL